MNEVGTSGGFGRGLDFLMKQRAKIIASGGDFVPKLFLRNDGDVAKFRFLTDIPDIFSHNFHEVSVQGRNKTFTKDVICKRKVAVNGETGELDFIDPVEVCEYCNRAEPLQMWWKGIVWVYTYGIFSLTKSNDKMTPARRGVGAQEIHGFAEQISELRLLILKGLVADMVGSAGGRYGTLCDRDYELERRGKGTGQFYELVGMDRNPPKEAVLEYISYDTTPIEGDEEGRVVVTMTATDKLPNLIETILKEFSLTPAGQTQQGGAPPSQQAQPAAQQPVGGEGPQAPAPRPDEVVSF